MSTSRLVRGTKSRFFLYVCAFAAFILVIYVFHGSQRQIEESEKSAALCLQQQESLSAQLQVIFEYKLRLEKSLQKEKADHKATREECLSKAQEEKTEREREMLEFQNKYNALEQHHKLLNVKHDDLVLEVRKLRQEKLQTEEQKNQLEKMMAAVKLEMQQTISAKDQALETLKAKYMKMEIDKEKLQRENEELKNVNLPESEKVSHLEKVNADLENQLSEVKKQLITSTGNEEGKEQKKSSIVAMDQQFGVEPPKMVLTGNNLSTTPGINPEAVIEHDASIKPVPSKSMQLLSSPKSTANMKLATQSAALPIQVPDKQDDIRLKNMADTFNNEANKHPIEEEPEPVVVHQVPETNVINKPDILNERKEKKDDLNEENQGGEIQGPMNPIQDNEIPLHLAPPLKYLENKRPIKWDTNKNNIGIVGRRPDLDGAHEEGDEEVAPNPDQMWKLNDDGKPHPQQMKPQYQGGDYDKEPPEEEEDEEGEQVDYFAADTPLKHMKQMAKFRQQLDSNGAGIMVNPK